MSGPFDPRFLKKLNDEVNKVEPELADIHAEKEADKADKADKVEFYRNVAIATSRILANVLPKPGK